MDNLATAPVVDAPAISPELPNYIDSSMLTTFRGCRRRFYWSYIEALSSAGRSVHLVAGAAFAAGLEAARRAAFAAPEGGIEVQLNAAFPAFLREWGDFEAPADSAKSFDRTFSALEEYLEQHNPLTDYLTPYYDDPLSVEYTFAIPTEVAHPITREPILFVGRFDMLARYNNLPCIVDEKTTSSLAYNWADQWGMRGQFIGYCWALQQLGIPVDTALVRGIAIQKTQNQFRTAVIQYPRHLINRWYHQLLFDLQRICTAYEVELERREQGHYHSLSPALWEFNFGDTCSSYGGCPFLNLCQAQDAEPFFTNYIRARWNPLSKQPLEELRHA